MPARPILAVILALVLPAAIPLEADAAKRRPGFDVSRFQKEIDWGKVANSRMRFVYAQASRGSGSDCTVKPGRCGRDRYYVRNYEGAQAAGLKVGAYHRGFADGATERQAKRDARAEARVFVKRVGRLRRGDLIPVLDVEAPFGSLNERRLRIWIRAWIELVHERLRERPMIYTNLTSWQETGDTTAFARHGIRLWIANFDVAKPSVPAQNWDGQGWTIWQHTSSGRVRGVHGNVDRNVLRTGLKKVTVRR